MTDGLVLLLLLLAGWFWWEKRQRVTHPMAGGLHADISLPHEQEYELYHNDLSLCSKKVRVCLAELGLDYKAHHIELIETGCYETISRHFLKVNPAGILPVLVHNGHPIYESHDIIDYIASQNQDADQPLVPSAPELREQMEVWKDLASLKGENPVEDLSTSAAACVSVLTVPLFAAGIAAIPYRYIFESVLFHRIRFRAVMFLTLKVVGLAGMLKLGKIDGAMRSAKKHLHVHLGELEQHLADGRSWIVGEEISLADVSWLVLFERLLEADWYADFLGGQAYPSVQAYWQRLQQRPSYHHAIECFRHPLVTEATHRIQRTKLENASFREQMLEGCARMLDSSQSPTGNR